MVFSPLAQSSVSVSHEGSPAPTKFVVCFSTAIFIFKTAIPADSDHRAPSGPPAVFLMGPGFG